MRNAPPGSATEPAVPARSSLGWGSGDNVRAPYVREAGAASPRTDDAARVALPDARTVGIAATWLGHSSVLLELDGARLVTDPLLRGRVGPLVRTAAPVAPGALDQLDAVLLSHLHADHAEIGSLRRLSRTATVIAPRGSGRWLAARGVCNLHELGVGVEVRVGPARIRATRAEHDARRRPLGGARAEPLGYVV